MANSAWSGNVLGLATATSPGLAQAGGYNILPAGTVLPYAGSTAPSGFLICDGSAISKTTYAQLYAAIADVYATQIDPTTGNPWSAPGSTDFRIPDYRASFLRSVGTPSIGDAVTLGGHQAQKTRANGLALSGTTTFASSSHYHTNPIAVAFSSNGIAIETPANGYNGTISGSATSGATPGGFSLTRGAITGSKVNTENNNASATVSLGTGDTETRPLNKGVNYIIKY